MSWRGFRHRSEYLFFRSVVCFLQALSPRQSVNVAKFLASFFFYVLPKKINRYHVARQNLRAAFGESLTDEQADRLIFQMWIHLMRVIIEVAQLPRKFHHMQVHDIAVLSNDAAVVNAMCSGRPVILISGHFGNWEMAVSVFGLFGFPMGVIARDFDNPYLHEWIRGFRQVTGNRLLSKKGHFDRIERILTHSGHVALLGDQDAGHRGTFVEFFGQPASTVKSVALLAMQHRAILCVGYARRLPDDFFKQQWFRFEVGCEEVIDPLAPQFDKDVDAVTQQFTAALERVIRRSPEQYFWLHRRWKTKPQPRQLQQFERRRKAS